MRQLRWVGPGPAAGLRARLQADQVSVARAPRGGELAVVVATPAPPRGGRPPGPPLPWIWMPPRPPGPAAVARATTAGAYDVVCGAGRPEQIGARLLARLEELESPPPALPGAAGLVADSMAGRTLLAELAQAARTSMPVLLTGETGTGKEVAARLLHRWSARGGRPFVPINCAAIPNELLESELFGYAKGAFSGAVQSYEGELAGAEGGSVFLDEVDDTPTSFQVKLLRVLEDRMVNRLGDNRLRKVDFRILAATNRDLRPLIARGLFGANLYERLAIVSIRLPPLRERREDLPALVGHMIARFYDEEPAARERHQVEGATDEALAVLAAYRWPGNIRELRNAIFGALVRKRAGRQLLVSDLPPRLSRPEPAGGDGDPVDPARTIEAALAAGSFNLRRSIEDLERTALRLALARTAGNAAAAAALLGEVGRGSAGDPGATVRSMMRRLGLAGRARRTRKR